MTLYSLLARSTETDTKGYGVVLWISIFAYIVIHDFGRRAADYALITSWTSTILVVMMTSYIISKARITFAFTSIEIVTIDRMTTR
jgi:hypothetical protein